MDCIIDGLEGVFAYMDDSRVGSPDMQTNLLHLEAFFNALATNGLAINLEKCVFCSPFFRNSQPDDFGNRIDPPFPQLFLKSSETTSTPGRDPTSTASSPKPTATPACCHSTSPSLNGGLVIFTLTWWNLYIIAITPNDVFTVIDHTSKWMEAVPLSDISAATWVRALIFSWISSFGVPETITFYLCI